MRKFALMLFVNLGLGETFFIDWFTDPPTVNFQKVKNKNNLDVNNFTILVVNPPQCPPKSCPLQIRPPIKLRAKKEPGNEVD